MPLQCRRPGFNPWVGNILWRREWLPTPVFLPGESHGQRSLAGYSPWGRKELDMTERLTYITSSRSIHIVPSGRISFLFKLNIFHRMCTTTSSSFSHLSADTGIVSMAWLLWIMLQWTWEHRCLFQTLISVIFLKCYWSIVDLQCCISFTYTAKWIDYMYTYILSFFFFKILLPDRSLEYWVEFPVLCSRPLLVTCFIYSGVYMSLPISQFIPNNHKLVFCICESTSAL